MRKRLLFLVALALAGCPRNQTYPSALLEQDESIVFPESFGPTPVVGRPGRPYALEGTTLQALLIATRDFLPPPTKETPCWDRPEAYAYQVLRQGEVIFIEIHGDPAACEGRFLMLDSGWRYAISVDGRILRRLQTGEPEWATPSPLPADEDAGVGDSQGELDLSGGVEVPPGSPPPRVPWRQMDGGPGPGTSALPLSSSVDGGPSIDGGAQARPER
jgi:hypothetical protein